MLSYVQLGTFYSVSSLIEQRLHQDLPPEEERVTETGSIHRLYPAPAPRAEALNVDEGWSADEISHSTKKAPSNDALSSSGSVRIVLDEPGKAVHTARISDEASTPELRTPATPATVGGGGFVGWAPVL